MRATDDFMRSQVNAFAGLSVGGVLEGVGELASVATLGAGAGSPQFPDERCSEGPSSAWNAQQLGHACTRRSTRTNARSGECLRACAVRDAHQQDTVVSCWYPGGVG